MMLATSGASGEQTSVNDIWESGTRNVKHETPDDSFNDSSFNDSVGSRKDYVDILNIELN
jgi:hypothetical protein